MEVQPIHLVKQGHVVIILQQLIKQHVILSNQDVFSNLVVVVKIIRMYDVNPNKELLVLVQISLEVFLVQHLLRLDVQELILVRIELVEILLIQLKLLIAQIINQLADL